jgi:YHS domain-containing protein
MPVTLRPATLAYTPGEYASQQSTGVVHMAVEKDPVCGMEVDTTSTDLKLEHNGTTYWFCGKGCYLEFRDDPERFLADDYVPEM